MTEILCVTCPVLRPNAMPRRPNNPQVCDGCRERLHEYLGGIAAALATVEIEPGRTGAERRTVGFESRPPLAIAGLSLIVRGSVLAAKEGRPYPQDQLGGIPPRELLLWWAEDWHAVRAAREQMPPDYVGSIATWLDVRLDWACDDHRAVDEFADDLRRLVGELRPYAEGDRGERVGNCPRRWGDDVCNTPLYVDPYVDEIQCSRCRMTWKRRAGEWMHLRAQQMTAGVEAVA